MGSDVAVVGEIPCSCAIKVHRQMCMELLKFVTRVSILLPQIEASRPRGKSGMQVLCLLHNAVDKAKHLSQQCSESSKLYLAFTGEGILSRCNKSISLFDQSLSQIQNMVPVVLAVEISQLVADLRAGIFSLDSSEEEAGKIVRELYTSITESAEEHVFGAIQISMRRLHITSQETLLIEKESIKKQLHEVRESNPAKRKILSFFMNLLKKYGKLIVTEETENGSLQHEDSFPFGNQCEVESRLIGQCDDASCSLLPDEFKCPLSLRLMYDPVVAASGLTYERFWIEKWFAEGNDTCPKTKKKLVHLSLTSNNTMKDLISRWTAAHGVSVPDPSINQDHSWESSSTSIASLRSSMNDLSLPVGSRNLYPGSSDVGPGTDSLHAKAPNDFNVVSMESNDTFYKVHESGGSMHHDMDLEPLTRFNSLSWDSQCDLVRLTRNSFTQNNQACNWMSSEDIVQTLFRFLKDAYDFHDLDAQVLGCLSLLAVLDKCRSSKQYLNDDAFMLLTSLLGSEVSKEALGVLEVLSRHEYCRHQIAASGALAHIPGMLDIHSRELQEPAIKTLCNMSESCKIGSFISPSEFILRLVPFLEDNTTRARECVIILKNLCINEDARSSVAETDGCIRSVVKLLDRDSREDQEHAMALLLTLCSQRVQYCQLVKDIDGVISDLFTISVNGNDKGKAMALELLRLLRCEFSDIGESFESDVDIPKCSPTVDCTQRKTCSKATRIFGKLFSRHAMSATKRIT